MRCLVLPDFHTGRPNLGFQTSLLPGAPSQARPGQGVSQAARGGAGGGGDDERGEGTVRPGEMGRRMGPGCSSRDLVSTLC